MTLKGARYIVAPRPRWPKVRGVRWMRVVGALLGAWLLVFAVVFASTVSAQAPDAIAQTHYEAGSGYFKAGDYASAVREFESAYQLSPRPSLLYDLYAAHEQLGHEAEAANYLQAYLGTDQQIENRGALETQLAELKRRLEPEPAPAVAAPAAEAPSGATTPQRPPVDDVRELSERFVQAMALFGVAGAGAVTFAVAGSLALKKDKDLAKSCGRDAGRTCSDDQVRGLRTRTTVADVGLGLLGVGAVLGVTLLWLDRRENARRSALRPVASFDVHGGSLALGGRF